MFSFFSKRQPPPKAQAPPAPALPTYDQIIESREDIRRLLITLTSRLDIPDMNDEIARSIVELWPKRRISPVTGQQVTQDEVLKELSSKCFIKIIRAIRADLKRIPEMFKEEGPEFIHKQIGAVLFGVVYGFATHHDKEVRMNPDGTLKSAKDLRAVVTFSPAPCNLKMLKSDYDRLTESEKESVRKMYAENQEIGANFLIDDTKGGRRKTKKKKRKARKTKRRV
uniref:Uncharacterized protein n=1 Tax=viral metagenome TaxID=1070528 RepID=A0A6C0B303_9ZZZZ